MKYYLIAGEASGDLHASHLMQALQTVDPEAKFRCWGGDLMQAAGGELVSHYESMAYMGFIPVLLHLPTILAHMRRCKQDIVAWQPDVVILVDYPGFNLKIARFVRQYTHIPTYYYIAPKIWAWKEYRIKNIRRDIDHLFSILPFEVDFFEHKHHYPIHYVGNPTLDEVRHYQQQSPVDRAAFAHRHGLSDRPIIALLAGSRRQEIKDNLPKMLQAASTFDTHQLVVAGAPGIPLAHYESFVRPYAAQVVSGDTYGLLEHSDVALVTSGTATLETALLGTPQVVCYHTPVGKLISFLRKHLLKVPYISLVNLIADKEVVKELVADLMTVETIREELKTLLHQPAYRAAMQEGYREVAHRLGQTGAPMRAAQLMYNLLKSSRT